MSKGFRLGAFGVLAVLCLLAGSLGLQRAQAAPADRGQVIVTPKVGSAADAFEFQGLVFLPHDHVRLYLEAPTGDVYQWVSSDSGADYVVVDGFASFDLSVNLAAALDTVPSGTWVAHFVPEQSNEVDATFTVQPPF